MHGGINRIIESSASKISATVSREITKISQDFAKKALDKYKFGFIGAATFALTICFAVTANIAFNLGVERGEVTGYEKSKDEKAAVAWANTKNAVGARWLDEKGELIQILNCSKAGYVVKKGICYPLPDKNNETWGWNVK